MRTTRSAVRGVVRRARRVIDRHRRPAWWNDPPLPIPSGLEEKDLRRLISSIRVDGGPPGELEAYWMEAFGRFLRTWDLARDLSGSGLELGANPYFLSVLLDEFSPLAVTHANYFGPTAETTIRQAVRYEDPTGAAREREFTSALFDAENDTFPFSAESFDVVIFCEIIEHMTQDPLATLREINRVLKPSGHLIVTTPNVARLENVARLIEGSNIYDPYSGYGPTGRHNREYNSHEMALLLRYAGFEVEHLFTADSHPPSMHYSALVKRVPGVGVARARDLGQYIFCRARKTGGGRSLRPSFLYRSFPDGQIEDLPGT